MQRRCWRSDAGFDIGGTGWCEQALGISARSPNCFPCGYRDEEGHVARPVHNFWRKVSYSCRLLEAISVGGCTEHIYRSARELRLTMAKIPR